MCMKGYVYSVGVAVAQTATACVTLSLFRVLSFDSLVQVRRWTVALGGNVGAGDEPPAADSRRLERGGERRRRRRRRRQVG